VRISLVDRGGGKQRRGQRRRAPGRRGSRTFESSAIQPRTQPSRRGKADRKATGWRAAHSQQSREPAVAALPQSARRKFRWRIAVARVLVFLVLIGLAASIVYGATAEEFFIYDAQIVGIKHLQPGEVYQVAEVHEQNIFWIDPEAVAERVSKLVGVKDVHVRCILPAQVEISVEECKPIVMWRSESLARDLWLDLDGIVLPYHGVLTDTIFVVDASEQAVEVGDQIQPEGIVRSLQQLDAALPEVEVFFFQADRGLSFTQRMDKATWPVYMGDSEDLPRKIQVLHALNKYLKARKIRPRYVDLRRADYPVYGKPSGRANRTGD
jgi:cell division septal protein FtsQ